MICLNGHKHKGRSQPLINRHSLGNIPICSAILFSSNAFIKIQDFFKFVGLQCIGKTRFYQVQKQYLAGVIEERYCRENKEILDKMKQQTLCCISRDGRCDSPGHNAKYLT